MAFPPPPHPRTRGCEVTRGSATQRSVSYYGLSILLAVCPHQNCDAPQLAIQRSSLCPSHQRVHSLSFFEQHLNGLLIIMKAFISTKYIIILKMNNLILKLKPIQLCRDLKLHRIQNLWFSPLICLAVHKKHNFLFKLHIETLADQGSEG